MFFILEIMWRCSMKKKFCILIAIFMFINILPANLLFANDNADKNLYVIVTNYSDQNYLNLRSKGKYVEAARLAETYLNEKEDELKLLGVDVKSRLHIVFVGFQALLSELEVEKIKALDFVKTVYQDFRFESEDRSLDSNRFSLMNYSGANRMNQMRPMMISSPELVGVDQNLRKKFSGTGRLLAVADNDMFPGHDAFSEAPSKLKLTYDELIEKLPLMTYQGQSITRDVYFNEKIPFAWNYQTNNNVMDPSGVLSGHGQHIAGTMVGKAININGRVWQGIAPDAQLAMMGLSGGTMTTTIEHAMFLGADAINISQGIPKGKRESFSQAIYHLMEQAYIGGLNVVVAAGNEGEYKGELSLLNPDYGNIDDPAFLNNIITVGSFENKTRTGYALEVGGAMYPVTPSNVGGMLPEGEFEYVDVLYGRPEDFVGKKLDGKIAFIKRGENLFMDKIENAQNNGAIGVIVYNNVSGEMGMSLDPKKTKVPSVAISLQDGESMKAQANKVLKFSHKPQITQNPKYGEVSSFSTYGLTAYGDLKPDLIAPGGEIFSTQNSKDTFTNMSGTSMATPHVAASIALVREYMDQDEKFKNIKHEDIANVVKAILMNSAVPHMDPKTKVATSPRRQGAGMLDVKRAVELEFTAVNPKTDIASMFINNVEDSIKFSLKLKNYTNKKKTITPSVATTIETVNGKVIQFRPGELFSKTLDQEITLDALEEKVVDFDIPLENLDKLEPFKNGAFIDGFITLKDDENKFISVPFASFKGDFDSLSMVEKPLYDFDFDSENPMYWNYKFDDHPWHKFSTHIETYVDESLVIAGVKNFADIELKDGKRNRPEFEDIVLSPNGDGKNDRLILDIVAVRDGKVLYKIKNEQGEEELVVDFGDHVFKNNSYMPDAKDNRTRGFTEFKETDITKFKEGLYTLEIGGSPIREEGHEVQDVFKDKIQFRIDKTEPKFDLVSFDEATRELKFEVKDDSFIRETYYELNGKKHVINDNTFVVPEGASKKDLLIYAVDGGYNVGKVDLEMLSNIKNYGMVRLDINAPKTNNYLDLKYKLVGTDGKEYKANDLIPLGEYDFVVEGYYPLYRLKGEKTQKVLLTKDESEKTVKLEFELVDYTTYGLYIGGNFSSSYDYNKIIVKAISKADNKEYIFNKGKSKGLEADLPNGEYKIEIEITDPEYAKQYIININNSEIVVNGQDDYNAITVEKNFETKVNYIINADEAIKKDLQFEINYWGGTVEEKDLILGEKYTVSPKEVPAGYICLPESVKIEFSETELTKDVEFNFVKESDEFNLKIEDSVNDAEYFMYSSDDFRFKQNPIKISNKEIRQKAGIYYVSANPKDDKYFVGKNEGKPSEFQKVILAKDTTLKAEWTEYTSKKFYKMFAVKSNASDLENFTIVLKDLKDNVVAKLNYVKGERNPGYLITQGVFKIEIPELGDAYNVVPNKFYNTEFAQGINDRMRRTQLIDIVEADPIDVKIDFVHDGQKVDGIKFNIDGQAYTNSDVSLAIGKHDLTIDSDMYKLTEIPREITVEKSTKTITIKLLLKDDDFVKPDKAPLEKMLKEHEILEKLESYSTLDKALKYKYLSAIDEAKSIVEDIDADNESVKSATDNLLNRRNELIGPFDAYLKAELQKLIEKAEALKENYLYTEASEGAKGRFDDKLHQAKNIIQDDTEYIGVLYVDLMSALKGLDGKKPADYEELDRLIGEYNDVINSDKFKLSTNEEKRNYQFAISDAKDFRKLQDSTNEAVEAEVLKIKKALEALSGKSVNEKTAKPNVEIAKVGDDKISGNCEKDSTIRVNVDGVDYYSSAVNKSGEFVVSIPKVKADNKIKVYATKKGYLESDPAVVKIEASDNDIHKLLKAAKDFMNTKDYKDADDNLKKKYQNAVELIERASEKDPSNDEINDLRKAIESIQKMMKKPATPSKPDKPVVPDEPKLPDYSGGWGYYEPTPRYNYKPIVEAKAPKKEEKKVEPKKEVKTEPVVITSKFTLDSMNFGINDSMNTMDVAPFAKDGRIMVPIRFVGMALGFDVSWDDATKTAILKDDKTEIRIPMKGKTFYVNGVAFEADAEPEIRSERIFLSISNIAKALGLEEGKTIFWDQATKTASFIFNK